MMTHTDVKCSLVSHEIQNIFKKWDSGCLNTDKTISALRDLGIVIGASFADLLNHFSRSRNLPFATFMKGLQQSHPQNENQSINALAAAGKHNSKELSEFNLKSHSGTSASEKAPYGTLSEIGADDGFLETMSVCSSVRCGTLKNSSKKHLTPTALIASSSFNNESEMGLEETKQVPLHMKTHINIFSSEDERLDNSRNEELDKSNIHADMLHWDPQGPLTPPGNSNKKHFLKSQQKTSDFLSWDHSIHPHQEISSTNQNQRQFTNILAHADSPKTTNNILPSILPPPRGIVYPYATERDDLESARASMQRQRLEKIRAQRI